MRNMNWKKWGTAAAVCFGMLAAHHVQADAVFAFENANGVGFDNTGVGASMTVDGIKMTTVDILGQDGSSASSGTGNTTYIGSSGLGVNSADNPQGVSSEYQNFDPNEAWIFSFDQDVYLSEINLASMGTGTYMTMSIGGTVFMTFDETAASDIWDLGDTLVTAGTEVMIQNTSLTTATDPNARIDSLTVIPEPATLGLLGACAVGAFAVRRFHM